MSEDHPTTELNNVPVQGTLHTAGPWRACQRPHTKGPPSDAPEDAHLDYFHIEAGEIGADGWQISGYMRPGDAHLIAAAPDLLYSLRAVRDWMDDPVINMACPFSVEQASAIRLAIAKAESRSNG